MIRFMSSFVQVTLVAGESVEVHVRVLVVESNVTLITSGGTVEKFKNRIYMYTATYIPKDSLQNNFTVPVYFNEKANQE